MPSSPTAKATEKEHEDNKEDNFSPFWGSIEWKEEWATNRSKIIRVDDLFKLTNWVVFGLEKGITKSPISPAKFHLWEILKALARPDCPSMQTDIKNFYKKLQDNKNLKQKRYSKNAKDWYTKNFVFPKPPNKEAMSDGETAMKYKKQIPVLQIYLVRSVLFTDAIPPNFKTTLI